MKSILKYILFFLVVLSLSTCKKKTTIKVTLFNPALNQNVANATVVLVEKHGESGGGLFMGNGSCKEIATGLTDADGRVVFTNVKLRKSENYDYYCAVKDSWGIQQSYPCGGVKDRFIQKGGSSDWLVVDYVDAFIQVQYNNLLSPSQIGDSLVVGISSITYYDPIAGHNQGGGSVFVAFPSNGDSGYPYASSILLSPVKTICGRKIVYMHKRKLGVSTTTTDTVSVYPNQPNIIQINW